MGGAIEMKHPAALTSRCIYSDFLGSMNLHLHLLLTCLLDFLLLSFIINKLFQLLNKNISYLPFYFLSFSYIFLPTYI